MFIIIIFPSLFVTLREMHTSLLSHLDQIMFGLQCLISVSLLHFLQLYKSLILLIAIPHHQSLLSLLPLIHINSYISLNHKRLLTLQSVPLLLRIPSSCISLLQYS